MPKKNHAHKHQHPTQSSEEGFISTQTNKKMNKNEKLIMGILIGGIIIFLVLSIIVLYSVRKQNSINNLNSDLNSADKKSKVIYPTIAPIVNMTVQLHRRQFIPERAEIPRGGFIDFLNIDEVPFTIEANDENSKIMNLGTIVPSDDKQVTFNTPGTYTYRNKDKPSETGTIIIK